MSSRIVRFMKGNTIAMIALFIALGGTASAATLAANSVGTKQLKKNAVTTAKIKNGAVTSAKIKAGTVTGANLAAGTVTGANLAAGTVTGDKVNVATLPKVPSAANADYATNAGTLGGVTKSVWGTAMMYQGTAFQPRSPGNTWASTGYYSGGIQCTAGSDPLFLMPLSLPQGATVTKVTMYYDNTVAGNSGSIWLTRFALATHTGQDIATTASGSTLGYGTVSITPNAVIDNTTNAYVLYWWPALNANVFGGALVEYTLPGVAGSPAVHAAAGQSSGLSTNK